MDFPKIDFAAHLDLSATQKKQVSCWGPMRRQIAHMTAAGFRISRILINGVSFVGNADDRKIFLIQTCLFYSTLDEKEERYHVNFMPDAAALLVALRVVDCERSNPQIGPISLDDYHVIMIKQPRIGAYEAWCLQVPAGVLDSCGEFDLDNMEDPHTGALREYAEEAVGGNFPPIRREDLLKLGKPVCLHPANTDAQYQFFVIKEVSQAQLDLIIAKVNGSRGTDPKEITQPCVIPLRVALKLTIEEGSSPWSCHMLMRFVRSIGCNLSF